MKQKKNVYYFLLLLFLHCFLPEIVRIEKPKCTYTLTTKKNNYKTTYCDHIVCIEVVATH